MNNQVIVNAVLKSGISKKTNQPYVCIEIELPNGYKKVVFPVGAEKFVFEQCLSECL